MVALPVIPGIFEPSTAETDYPEYVRRVARAKGVPEDIALGVFNHESSLDVNSARRADFGNGGGVGQFTTDTAAQYGTSQQELRDNPRKAIEVGIQLLRDNAGMFGGDFQKGAAAYFIGPGNVQEAERQGGGDWLGAADRIAAQYGQGTVSQYLSAVGGGASQNVTSAPIQPTGSVGGSAVGRSLQGLQPVSSTPGYLYDAKGLQQNVQSGDVYPAGREDTALRSTGTLRGRLLGNGPDSSSALEPGNIDLSTRPHVRNPDGSISTVRSISINEDGREILIPTVSDDGRVLSNREAIDLYHQTKRHLGVFPDPATANAYAEALHNSEAAKLANDPGTVRIRPHTEDTSNPLTLGLRALGPVKDIADTGIAPLQDFKGLVKEVGNEGIPGTGLLGRTLANPVNLMPGVGLINQGVNAFREVADQVGGVKTPGAGDLLSEQVPTTPAGVITTIGPGNILKGAKSAGGLLRGAEEAPGVLNIIGDAASVAKKAREAKVMYQALKDAGHSDEEIAGVLGQQALDLAKGGAAAQRGVAAGTELTGQAQSQAARDAYTRVLKDTGSVEKATEAARNAAGAEAGATSTLRGRAGELSERMKAPPGAAGIIDPGSTAYHAAPAGIDVLDAAKAAESSKGGIPGLYLAKDAQNPEVLMALENGGGRVHEVQLEKGTKLFDPAVDEWPKGLEDIKQTLRDEHLDLHGETNPTFSEVMRKPNTDALTAEQGARLKDKLAAEGYKGFRSDYETVIWDNAAIAKQGPSALAREADRLDAADLGANAGSTIGDIATAAKRLGDPASEIRRQLQQGGGQPDTVNAARANEYTDAAKAERQAARDERNATREQAVAAKQAEQDAHQAEIDAWVEHNRAAVRESTAETEAKLKAMGDFAISRPLPPPGTPESGSHSLLGRVWNEAVGLSGVPISLKSSLSPPLLRQGLARVVTNPVAAFREFGVSMKAMANENYARAVQKTIEEDPWIRETKEVFYQEAGNKGYTWKDVGGQILDWGDKAAKDARPEELAGLAVNESKIGKAAEALTIHSNRQAAVELNLHRTNWYSETASKMWDAGLRDVNDYKELRKTIEQWTGRGSVPQPSSVPFFFSTRALSGRAQSAWRGLDAMAHAPEMFMPGARQEAGKALVGVLGAGTAFIGGAYIAAKTAGLDPQIETKDGLPTLRIGAEHFDPWAGSNTIIKFGVGVGKDLVKAAGNGDLADVPQTTIQQIAQRSGRFLRGSLSPYFGKVADAATGTDFLGKPYSLAQDVSSGNIVKDLGAPFIAESLIDAFKQDGLPGVAVQALPSALSMSTGSYNTTAELRNDAARKLGAADYSSASPLIKQQIDALPQVKSAVQDSPSDYQQRKAAVVGEIDQAERTALDAFKAGTNTQKITDIWHDLGQRRLQAAKDLSSQFAEQFKGFDKSKYDTALQGYYDTQKTFADGTPDFDATDAARKEYLSKLPADQQQWLTEAQTVAESKKTPERQKYDAYIAAKKQAGYMDIKPTDPKAAQKRAELDRANPELDLASWYYSGTTEQAGAGLNSTAAADRALALNLPNRPVKLTGYARPVNESPEVRAVYDGTKQLMSDYEAALANPRNLEAHAQDRYQKSFDKLTDAERSVVHASITRDLQNDHPQLDAVLAFFGRNETLSSDEAVKYLKQMIDHAGIKDPAKDKILQKVKR